MAEKKVEFPQVNMDAYVAIQKANIDTMVEARNIVMNTVQAIAKLQYGWFEQSLKHAEAFVKGDVAKRKPEDFFAEVKAVTEHAVDVGKQQADLGLKAQQEVADLMAKRVQKNFEDAKALAA